MSSFFLSNSINLKSPPHKIFFQKRSFGIALRLTSGFRARCLAQNSEVKEPTLAADQVAKAILESSNLKTAAKTVGPVHEKITGKWSTEKIILHCAEIVGSGVVSFLLKKYKWGDFKEYWPYGLGKMSFVEGQIVRLHFGGGQIFEGLVKARGDFFRNTILESFEKRTILSLSPQDIRSDCKLIENLGYFWTWEHVMYCMKLDKMQIQVLKLVVSKLLEGHPCTIDVQSNMEPGPVIDGYRETQIRCRCTFSANDWKSYDKVKGELWELLEPWDPQTPHGNIVELIKAYMVSQQVEDDKMYTESQVVLDGSDAETI